MRGLKSEVECGNAHALYTLKAVFVKLKQIDGFETIIPIIATIISFVNCKL
jgi:hypothetical protein